jgi:Polyketide cyclase / dehydrase and lipid transport
MIAIAAAHVAATAPPSAIFERWADVATWPQWNADTEWVRLDGAFAQGGTGLLKPKGGPKVKFVIDKLTDTEFVDVSRLVGARLTFSHRVIPTADGCLVDVAITMSGPLAWLWNRILGKGLAASVQPDLDSLARAAESGHTLAR